MAAKFDENGTRMSSGLMEERSFARALTISLTLLNLLEQVLEPTEGSGVSLRRKKKSRKSNDQHSSVVVFVRLTKGETHADPDELDSSKRSEVSLPLLIPVWRRRYNVRLSR